MIIILAPNHYKFAAELVAAAFRRSSTFTQVKLWSGEYNNELCNDLVVAINPDEEISNHIMEMIKSDSARKILLLGKINMELMRVMDLSLRDWPSQIKRAARSDKALPGYYAESKAKISYCNLPSYFGNRLQERALERFDFADEWNNMGFGAIRVEDSDWSISIPVEANSSNLLAEIKSNEFEPLAYASLKDLDHQSIMWFNRAVGPIDSFEWQIIEKFISGWRSSELPCIPILREIPLDFECCVTMRLDCDEDIESARGLRNEYKELEVPFSLAIHTKNLQNIAHHALIKEMAECGESILSHSATHASNWGGSYAAAINEARDSGEAIKQLTGIFPKYAVSPFHQTPGYALKALINSGYQGCIGGIICCNPEFNLARGGELAQMPRNFIGHSQQHMLHGDCMLIGSDPLATSKQAFELAKESNSIFGYLDHPFSERYSYGWSNEATRAEAHRDLILFIKESTKKPLFLSEVETLDFIQFKSNILIKDDDQSFTVHLDKEVINTHYDVCIEYKGSSHKAVHGLKLPKTK